MSDFGGDPDQITVFGDSAGGISVRTFLISSLAKDLLQRAIIQSGPCVGKWYVVSAQSA